MAVCDTPRMAKAIDPLVALEKYCGGFPSYVEAAKSLGISKQFLHGLRREARPLPDHILEKLGLRRVVLVVAR
jgi:hypothetical protein